MKNRAVRTAVCLLLCVFLSGCEVMGMNVQNLMSPPKATADQQAIHSLLRGDEMDIAFAYPKTGEYRSAIIMGEDLPMADSSMALGFCVAEDGSVKLQFFGKLKDEWRISSVFSNTATQVDRVCFGDFNGDKSPDVLVGWGSTQGTTGRTASCCVYVESSGGEWEEYQLGTYGELIITDLDSNGIDEIFTIDKYIANESAGEGNAMGDLPARASLYIWDNRNGHMSEKYTVQADNSITAYMSVRFGYIGKGVTGVVLDGSRADGSSTTQIFSLNEETGSLMNVHSGVNTEEYDNPFIRPSPAVFYSRDINSDEIIEIPILRLLPGIPENAVPDSTCYRVDWCVYDRLTGRRVVMNVLMNLTENYYFNLPHGLRTKITAVNDIATRTVHYLTHDTEHMLFSIRVFPGGAWQTTGSFSGYEYLAMQDDLVYAIKVHTDVDEYLEYAERIKKNFSLLSE